ncbi:hypothetical protein [Lactobacillus sp. ESL0681]|uniref:hypothetical protein n=1 Tax=Lactobacillus sp. ESL0681 TaxID=2983211 RepID=UPI0023FA06C2|nr:hypothetical protein [Lactobacillus sp. ESL0681]WEV39943.1 hypothetical protein OZX59_06945 [Lactobacillus sp. ESL0681]
MKFKKPLLITLVFGLLLLVGLSLPVKTQAKNTDNPTVATQLRTSWDNCWGRNDRQRAVPRNNERRIYRRGCGNRQTVNCAVQDDE